MFMNYAKAIHILYDNSVNPIAFNRDEALFFNLKFYHELHEQPNQQFDTISYKFMMLCHVIY